MVLFFNAETVLPILPCESLGITASVFVSATQEVFHAVDPALAMRRAAAEELERCGALLRRPLTQRSPQWLWLTFFLPWCQFSLPRHFSCFDVCYEMVAFGNRWGNEASRGHKAIAKGKV